MAYKTIVVDGTEYKYVLGRTHLKVRGLGVVEHTEIQHPTDYDPWRYGPNTKTHIVTPGDIARWIRQKIS
jgi:hypothetical protein